jgi:hypothetical protein
MLPLAFKIRFCGAVLVAFFALCSIGAAQKNIDLEFVSQKPTQLRGGERFILQSTVVNLSETAATDVHLRFDDERRNLTFLTATPSQGECKIEPSQWLVNCVVGTIKINGPVTISLEAQIRDFGGENFTSIFSKRPLGSLANSNAPDALGRWKT